MRLTASRLATVVRGSGWQARGLAGAQDEAGNRRLERGSVLAEQTVIALHPAFAGLQDAEALIFVHRARYDRRLFADYAFPDHFGVHAVADRVMNEPTPGE